MNLPEQLENGTAGVRLRLPEGKLLQQSETSLLLETDGDLNVGLHVVHLPFRLDLSPQNDQLLHEDVERHLRGLFAESFEPVKHPLTEQEVQPRTSDPEWSPLVEFERLHLPEPALWLLFRTQYAPTKEAQEGRLIVPVEDGIVCITLLASESMTGYRESALTLLHDEEFPDKRGSVPDQQYYDSPEHDEKFPTHGLSRIRRARAWLMAKNAGRLTIVAPAQQEVSREHYLPEAECSVVAPPRFVRLPRGTLAMSETLVAFTRVVLGRESPRLFSVWLLPDEEASGTQRLAKVEQIAVESVQGWTREGAEDIRINTQTTERWGGCVRLHVRFKARGESTQEVQCRFADDEGQVYRIASNGPPSLDPEQLWAEVKLTRDSWKRVAPPPAKPWWKLWS